MKARIRGGSIAAVLALSASLIAFSGVSGAQATQGQPLIAGQANGETNETVVKNTNVTIDLCTRTTNDGLLACGDTALTGLGDSYGVYGHSASSAPSTAGVFGQGVVD